MYGSLAEYREWLRLRLGIATPLSAGMEDAVVGAESPVTKEPNNYVLNNYIRNACDIVNQQIGIRVDSQKRSLPISAQTADGLYSIDLLSMPGYRPRSLISIRRAWWNDGSTSTRLTPMYLNAQDRVLNSYVSADVATPQWFAIEGNTLFLSPSPVTAGTFEFMATYGALAPQSDNEPFEGIPESYDPCILYIALVEYGKSMPRDNEMSMRAQAFTSDAAAGLDRLAAWFAGNNEQAQADLIFDATSFRRNAMRR